MSHNRWLPIMLSKADIVVAAGVSVVYVIELQVCKVRYGWITRLPTSTVSSGQNLYSDRI